MKINIYYVAILVIIVILFGIGFLFWTKNQSQTNNTINTPTYKNLTYVIESSSVMLINGHSEQGITPGSVSKTITDYFGNEAFGDINSDGLEDVVFILNQQTGGSGTFYYVAAALKTSAGYKSTNTVFLGDRIAPQGTEIKEGVVTVNFAERKDGEPMTAAPTVGVSKYLKIENGVLVEKSVSQSGACYIGGCSNQICSDQKDVVSTCEYREEYACYKNATCEMQSNGKCGWTATSELTACLQK